MSECGAVYWQPTGLMGMLERVWGCMLERVCWPPTGLIGHVGAGLGL